jgi:hypothetical protein
MNEDGAMNLGFKESKVRGIKVSARVPIGFSATPPRPKLLKKKNFFATQNNHTQQPCGTFTSNQITSDSY